MARSLLLGVELPPVPVGATSDDAGASASPGTPARPGPDVGAWWEAARAAADAGAGVVWFRGAGGPATLSCDACTIAAAAVDQVPGVHLGVVSSVPLERHPAVLAREVTALDVVSDGRAAVLLQWSASDRSSGIVEVSEQFAEAVAVCSAVLREEDPVFEGRHFHVAGALNRPPPVQEGGPPVFSGAPAGPAALASARDATGFGALRLVLRAASAIVCSDDPADVSTWKYAIDEAIAVSGAGGSAPPALVCRTTMQAATGQRRPDSDLGPALAARLRAARDAGADGVIVRLPPSRRVDLARRGMPRHGSVAPPPSSVLGPALRERFAPWTD
ncbi:MAG: LLM class flavin-dependent oxidoreductase [Acidimicrobiales bacterium]